MAISRYTSFGHRLENPPSHGRYPWKMCNHHASDNTPSSNAKVWRPDAELRALSLDIHGTITNLLECVHLSLTSTGNLDCSSSRTCLWGIVRFFLKLWWKPDWTIDWSVMLTMLILPSWRNTALRSRKNFTSTLLGRRRFLMAQAVEQLASIQRSGEVLLHCLQTNLKWSRWMLWRVSVMHVGTISLEYQVSLLINTYTEPSISIAP